jgi:hypothetical protein
MRAITHISSRLYYQYSPDRLSTCPVTIHSLLHIADGIEEAGPVWAYWAFPMERFCGLLQPAIRSRRYPYPSMDTYVVATAQLSQLKHKFNLHQELLLAAPKDPLRGNYFHPSCKYQFVIDRTTYTLLNMISDPTCVLLPPHRISAPITDGLFAKIAICLSTRYNQPRLAKVKKHLLLENIEQWGKVRRLDGGDTMHASSAVKKLQDSRDASFIRVCIPL